MSNKCEFCNNSVSAPFVVHKLNPGSIIFLRKKACLNCRNNVSSKCFFCPVHYVNDQIVKCNTCGKKTCDICQFDRQQTVGSQRCNSCKM
jgi:hypothetical protein